MANDDRREITTCLTPGLMGSIADMLQIEVKLEERNNTPIKIVKTL